MNTSDTYTYLESAANYLRSANSALTHGRHSTFVDKLRTACALLEEVLLNSTGLTDKERIDLAVPLGLRLLDISDCRDCWEGIMGCVRGIPEEKEEEKEQP